MLIARIRSLKEGVRRSDLHLLIHESLLLVMAFLFPVLQRALPLVAILLAVNALVFGIRAPRRIKGSFRAKDGKGLLLIIAAYFLLYLVGGIYSTNAGLFLFDLQKKVGFLVFPLLFACMPSLSVRKLSRVLKSFILGCLLAVLIGTGQALISYFGADDPLLQHLYGHYFAFGIHRSYLAIYLLFGAYLAWRAFFSLEFPGNARKERVFLLLFLLLLAGVFMTASRAALLCIPLLVAAYVLNELGGSGKYRFGILFVSLGILAGVLFMFPKNQQRIQKTWSSIERFFEAQRGGAEGELEGRFRYWSVAGELYSEHWLLGVGTGDDDIALAQAYRQKGYEESAEKRRDAHSQYLQTGIAIGLPGVLLLLAWIFRGGVLGVRKNGALLQLSILLFVSALFESVLERQAGILFFAFFFSFLTFDPGLTYEQRTRGGRG